MITNKNFCILGKKDIGYFLPIILKSPFRSISIRNGKIIFKNRKKINDVGL
jgi:hypothetical protein